MNQKIMHFKSLQKVFVLLLIANLPFTTTALREDQMIHKTIVSFKEDFSILPHEKTKESLCNDEFLQNVYGQLAMTYLTIYQQRESFGTVENYKTQLQQLHQRTQDLADQIQQFLTLEIIPKPLISPTFFKTYQTNKNTDFLEIPLQDTQKKVLSQPFLERLLKDKELYAFIIKTEQITSKTKALGDTILNRQRQLFLEKFPDFNWIGNSYNVSLYGQDIGEQQLQKLEKLTLQNYRFWSLRMLKSLEGSNLEDIELLMNTLNNLQQNQITDEIKIFGCDLYAAMLFQFQCVMNLKDSQQDLDISQTFQLFKIIQNRFYSDTDRIRGLMPCRVAIPPQEYFTQYMLGLTFMFQEQNIQKSQIKIMLDSDLLDEFSDDKYEPARYFFNFDKYIIDFLNGDISYHHMEMDQMRSILITVLEFRQYFKNDQTVNHNIMFQITLFFLDYLQNILNNQSLRQIATEEGILYSVKVQYLIFTYIRIEALKTGDFGMFKDFQTFMLYFTNLFGNKLDQNNRIMNYIGEDRYLTTIFINIEIIVTYLYQNDNNKRSSLYEQMGDTIEYGLLDLLVQENINQLLVQKIQQYQMITDDDFETHRMIWRVFLQNKIIDMIIYINSKKELKRTNSFDNDVAETNKFEQLSSKNKLIPNQQKDHLILKRILYKFLVQILSITQEQQTDQKIKVKLLELIQKAQSQASNNNQKNDIKKIYDLLNKTQINFMQAQHEIYYNIYLYGLKENYQLIQGTSATEEFLSFIQIYKEENDVKFERLSNDQIPQEELRHIRFFFGNQIFDDVCVYEDKWNEILFMDAAFLYPFLFVKHRNDLFPDQQNKCQEYDPYLMTEEEGRTHNLPQQELNQLISQQTTHCIQQRQESFKKFLLDEDIQDQSGQTQIQYINNIILSPEFFLEIEQFEFMIDAFQVFKIFKKINGERLMVDQVIKEIYYDIYKFIIQIRSDPNFVYDFDIWGTLNSYIERCMLHERFPVTLKSQQGNNQNQSYFFCAFGYARYNEMYWFIKDAQYKAVGDFSIMANAWYVDRNNQNSINWGDRTHGRMNYFTHYLIKLKTFSQYDTNNQDMVEYNKDNNWKSEIWGECAKYSAKTSNIDYCKFLYKVGKIIDQFQGVDQPLEGQYNALQQILAGDAQTDNDKIITWEVLDFFQFESNKLQDPTIENIRKIFDSQMLTNIRNGINGGSLTELLQISDIKLLGDYAVSKYDVNYTVRSLESLQDGLYDVKNNDALHKLINEQILTTRDKSDNNMDERIQKFLELNDQNSSYHKQGTSKFKIVHSIPLSLLLYYADELREFQAISRVLLKTNHLDMLFLSDTKAGKAIVKHFSTYMNKYYQTKNRQTQNYTYDNLRQYIVGVEETIANNRTVKKQNVMLNQGNGSSNFQQFKSTIALGSLSLGSKTKKVQTQVISSNTQNFQPLVINVAQEKIDNEVIEIGHNLNKQEIDELSPILKVSIKQQVLETDMNDTVKQISSNQNLQQTRQTIEKDLLTASKLSSVQSLDELNHNIDDKYANIQITQSNNSQTKESFNKQELINQVNFKVNVKRTVVVTRNKHEIRESKSSFVFI